MVDRVIETLKRDRIVLMTTHNMEEADALGDTIGILANGRLRAIGTSLFLKSQFGAGYEVSLNAASREALPRLTALVHATLPGAKIATESSTHVTVELPRRRRTIQQIPGFFNALASVSGKGKRCLIYPLPSRLPAPPNPLRTPRWLRSGACRTRP